MGDQGGCLAGCLVSADDLFEDLDGGGCLDEGAGDRSGVRIRSADLEPGVVGGPSAREHGVGELAGLVSGEETVAGVGGDALGGVDGGGVAEFDRLADVVGGQSEPIPVAEVLDVDRAVVVDFRDVPAVAVADPCELAGGESAVCLLYTSRCV